MSWLHLTLKTLLMVMCKTQNFTLHTFTLPQPLYQHYSGIFDNTFEVINGHNTLKRSYSISINPYSDEWIEHNPVNMPLGATMIWVWIKQTIQIDNLIYIMNPGIGGNPGIYKDVMFIYNLSSHKYIHSNTAALGDRLGNSCAVFNSNYNIIYVIGDFYSNQATQFYNISNGEWDINIADNIVRRFNAGCAMEETNNYIFLFGGSLLVQSSITTDSIEKYSVNEDKWIELNETLIQPRRSHQCVLLNTDNNIYCIGGMHMYNSNYGQQSVQVFNPNNYIIYVIYLNVGRHSFATSVWNGSCIIVSGGQIGDGVSDDSIEYFGICPFGTQTPTDQPTEKPTMNTVNPTVYPTGDPSNNPTLYPSNNPTTFEPTTFEPTTFEPTTFEPTTFEPTAFEPTTYEPTISPTECGNNKNSGPPPKPIQCESDSDCCDGFSCRTKEGPKKGKCGRDSRNAIVPFNNMFRNNMLQNNNILTIILIILLCVNIISCYWNCFKNNDKKYETIAVECSSNQENELMI